MTDDLDRDLVAHFASHPGLTPRAELASGAMDRIAKLRRRDLWLATSAFLAVTAAFAALAPAAWILLRRAAPSAVDGDLSTPAALAAGLAVLLVAALALRVRQPV